MAGTEGKTWMLLAVSCASLFGAAFPAAQECSLPDDAFIRTSVIKVVRSLVGSDAVVIPIQYHFTCIAVGSTQGKARSLSIAARYNVTVNDRPEEQLILQMVLLCSGGNKFLINQNEFNQPESLFDLETRVDCFACASSGSPTIDPPTNCAGKNCLTLGQWTSFICYSLALVCDPVCAGGQGSCVTSFTDCCRFYDVVNRTCINNCSAGSVNTTDYTCGKQAS